MRVVEEFISIQGEGKYIGTPSYFIRTVGCNLRCVWKNDDGTVTACDTPYASFRPEKGYEFKIDKTLEKLVNSNIEHVVITGGEPTLMDDLPKVAEEFYRKGYFVTVETNGTKHYDNMPNAFISISPKLSNSYNQLSGNDYMIHVRNNMYHIPSMEWMRTNDYQFKFVVNSPEDIAEIERVQTILRIPNNKIYLMPQGVTNKQLRQKSVWIVDEAIKHGWNFTPRLHINLFGNVRGK